MALWFSEQGFIEVDENVGARLSVTCHGEGGDIAVTVCVVTVSGGVCVACDGFTLHRLVRS